jgi:hypothetical protein
MATPTTANLPTRQQLDEIDALLRRMLTLPPLSGEPAEPPSAPLVNRSFPAPIIRETPPPHPPAPSDPVVQSWRVEWPPSPASQVPPPASPPSVVAWGSPIAPPTEAPPWAVPAATQMQPPYAMPVSAAANSTLSTTVARKQSDSLIVLSLIVLNGVFNLLTYLLGPLGTWLRGPGRGAMGWVGILMIVAAIVWGLGEWYGYDWPKPNLSRFGLSR